MTSQESETTRQAATEWPAKIQDIETSLGNAPFLDIFIEDFTKSIVAGFVKTVVAQNQQGSDHTAATQDETTKEESPNTTDERFRIQAIRLGLACLGAFLQANVTGPILESTDTSDAAFASAYEEHMASRGLRTNGFPARKKPIESFKNICLRSLDIDGVSVYSHIPHIELFAFARFIFISGRILPIDPPEAWEANSDDTLASNLSWTRLRVHLWHYKLLSQPSLGPGSLFTKSGRCTDVATLQGIIEKSLSDAEAAVTTILEPDEGLENHSWSHQARIQFYLEKANAYLMLGNDTLAKRALQSAIENSGFVYALSGALGKRTRFQEKDISQLVVLAKSAKSHQVTNSDVAKHKSLESAPTALPLNDDTLLEDINFKNQNGTKSTSILPEELQGISPDNQPKLKPEDQIILLTEATLRDTFSPSDALTSEEILPFAVRVINDKRTNWQIYTQALLVRSRIELHRSRTLERAVLQMQAVVDQVIVDTQTPIPTRQDAADLENSKPGSDVPSIEITATNGRSTTPATSNKPTSFLPAPKPTESASAQERLRYVNALASPPRWHLESELAYAWASVGSLVSAMEIFKRLRLWAEVALCLASNAASDGDDDRDGRSGEEKARAIVRWRLYHRTGFRADDYSQKDDNKGDIDEEDNIDISTLKASDFQGPERSPPPPNAPRLFCILGDLEGGRDGDAERRYYERAWEISAGRFARAQRSLAELHMRAGEWARACDAYAAAIAVNRLSPEMWGRLGDVQLRLGHFPDAAEAFQRSIAVSNGTEGGEDARTWSNLGSALLSWYREVVAENKAQRERERLEYGGDDDGTKERGGGVMGGGEEEKNDDDNDDDERERDTKRGGNATVIDEETMTGTARAALLGKHPQRLLQDALEAFKRGATIADSNWRIWDNVVTLAASLGRATATATATAAAFGDVLLGTRNVLRIRKTEDALDLEILTLLVREVTGKPPPSPAAGGGEERGEVYEPPRASLERKVLDLFENDVVPLLTARSEPWALVSRLRAWRRDWAGALDAAEKGWRAAVGGSGAGVVGGGGGGGGGGGASSLSTPSLSSSGNGNSNGAAQTKGAGDWLQDTDAWDTVVQRTSELVAAYENYGDRAGGRWRGKARMSVRSVMNRGREAWEGSKGWGVLESLLEGLRTG